MSSRTWATPTLTAKNYHWLGRTARDIVTPIFPIGVEITCDPISPRKKYASGPAGICLRTQPASSPEGAVSTNVS